DDVRDGFRADPKRIPSKYHYDARGSELFERITELPEYYLTRTETTILERVADEIMRTARPEELVELGSGASPKTRLLLETMRRQSGGHRYVPFDVSEDAMRRSALALATRYAWLDVNGFLGDLHTDLHAIPREGRRILAFLGSTIGNFEPDEARSFYRQVAGILAEGDRLLVGYDLVKDRATLEAAYNDTAGITEEFSRNVLRVINRELDADFPADDFVLATGYHEERARIESGLRSPAAMTVRIAAIDMRVELAAGEIIRTEISAKFTRERVARDLAACGLELERWDTDADGWFALALSRVRRHED
ncbi:MAG: L-histidine N(alpha)-methyltransferase, partial [Acidobacteriota bacterium]|nr:L-histidine N(alpha)-methyltransferase [Acidobacteriota bacterium]